MTGDELKRIRKELGLTQAQLAKLIGAGSDRTVRKWEDDERAIPGPLTVLLDVITNCPQARKFLGI